MTTSTAMYCQEGGNNLDGEQFGCNPLDGYANKINIRQQAFRYPSFEDIFHNLINFNSTLLQDALKFYVDITYRLSKSTV